LLYAKITLHGLPDPLTAGGNLWSGKALCPGGTLPCGHPEMKGNENWREKNRIGGYQKDPHLDKYPVDHARPQTGGPLPLTLGVAPPGVTHPLYSDPMFARVAAIHP
jgi:hypothetical protein